MILFRGDRWVVDAPQLLIARSRGIIEHLPDISEDEVDDRNKGDFLVKGLALGQVTWLVIQLVVRAAKSLPVSQLEILTLAYSACAIVTYLILWSKPQDVKTPITIKATRRPTIEQLIALANRAPVVLGNGRVKYTIPNRAVHRYGNANPFFRLGVGCGSGAILFGSLHCLAWDFTFPTSIERLLWRISAILTNGLPILAMITNLIFWKVVAPAMDRRHKVGLPGVIAYYVRIAFSVPYIFARLYVLVEVFRALAFLPPPAFRATWSSNLPHYG